MGAENYEFFNATSRKYSLFSKLPVLFRSFGYTPPYENRAYR